jgi:3D (Asp-Asp-Asp) domain-containing protein
VRAILCALVLALLPATEARAGAPVECSPYRVTAYASSEYPGWTADGSTTTRGALARGEPIAAASRNVPFNAVVDVDGLGAYRVADRGHLDARHIDVLVGTRDEALEIGSSYRTVCVTVPVTGE